MDIRPNGKLQTVKSKKADLVVEVAATDNTPEVIVENEVLSPPKATAKAEPESAVALAKAGKHSAKAVKATEAKQAKEARKDETVSQKADAKPAITKKPTRTKAERAGKKYRELAKLIDQNKLYSLPEALALATQSSPTKFDATVELHINLNVDPKQADQNIRDTVVMPAGTGKTIRIAVLAEPEQAAAAKAAGADIAGDDDLLQQLDKEQIEFDVLIATPSMMPRLGKYARLLGPKGLMPNPKSGTVATDVAGAVKQAKAGRVEYRVDQAGIVHLGIGKVSFGPDKLAKNAEAVLASIKSAKPSGLKATYFQAMTISTTMGPGIKVEVSSRS